ncbi:Beta glucanase [Streptococcus pneumoniae]|nr:Beta glucanase [Streptococcus pneumoniae]
MKNNKLIFSLFILFLLIFIHAKVFANENLIKNSNFEQGELFWNSRNRGIINSNESYSNGHYSGMIPSTAINGNRADGYIGQVIDIEPNEDYLVSAFAKVDVSGAEGYFTARWFDDNKQGEIVQNNIGEAVDQTVNTTEWKKYMFSFNSGKHDKVLIQLVKWSEDDTTKKSNIFIDNVEMYQLSKGNSYKKIWRDDFDGEQLNKKYWGYELGSIRGWEQQHYVRSDENIFLRSGNLVLRATNRSKEDQYFNPRNNHRKVVYNSGSVRTHGKVEFLYGKLEMRAKLPKGQGVFPAFWTLGSDFTLDGKINPVQGRGWPSTGEIDIMELVGERNSNGSGNKTVYQTLHYGQSDNDDGKFAGHGTAFKLSSGNFNDSYHTFSIDWYKDYIVWMVDNHIVRKVYYGSDNIAKKIFNRPQYVQLNLAMGGNWPGVVDNNLSGTEFVVDYVSYSRNDLQQHQAEEYYSQSPKINGAKDIVINRGDVPDLLKGITTNSGYELDYSIENEPMFNNFGGNTSVDLLIRDKTEKEKISQMPPGVYNLHYTSRPKHLDYESKVDRKTVTLTIK